jgi:hypothetical protein
METREIDGTLFFVTSNGKREVIQTSAEVAADANTAINQASAAIVTMSREAADLQRQIEAAILADERTADIRAQLAIVQAGIDQERRNIEDAEQRIRHIQHAAVEQHAKEISGQHRAETAAALAAFDTRQLSADLNAILRP